MLKAFKQQLGHHFCDMKFNPMHNAAKLDLTLYRISKSDNWKGHTTIWCYLSNMTKTAFVLTSKFLSFILEYMLRTFDFLSSTCQYSKHITIWHCSQVKLHPVLWLTLLGLGLIKINDVSANFNNPRPSLILNN